VIAALSTAVVVLAVGVLAQRAKPDLDPWHRVDLDTEFRASDASEGFNWGAYLRLEDRLFAELETEIGAPSDDIANPRWSRYAPAGINNPERFPRNWNRSFELAQISPVGGALLIHGLTDSPYSLRRTGELLHELGFHVVGLRLPGHGTAPSSLRDAGVADWRAAARIAVEHLQEVIDDTDGLILVGYSNGGALSLDLALDALEDDDLRVPDRIVLFSPAVGITRVAALARSHRLFSFMPWFDKLEWAGIEPEYDPFKYNSFPKDAGYQTHVLTRSVRGRIAGLQQSVRTGGFPPVLTFMSLADATVQVEAVVDGLYDQLARPENELVIFDIDRQSAMRGFFRTDPADRLGSLLERSATPYRLTVLSNRDDGSPAVVERTRAAGETEFVVSETGLEWPRGVYSLSHVAVPFPPDDPVYGSNPSRDAVFGVQLGTLEARGERGLLAVSASHLTRLRSNPFFPYVERRLAELGTNPAATRDNSFEHPPPRTPR
jgi:alpha-beta hydrolase superfamily lysophospholipase